MELAKRGRPSYLRLLRFLAVHPSDQAVDRCFRTFINNDQVLATARTSMRPLISRGQTHRQTDIGPFYIFFHLPGNHRILMIIDSARRPAYAYTPKWSLILRRHTYGKTDIDPFYILFHFCMFSSLAFMSLAIIAFTWSRIMTGIRHMYIRQSGH